MMTDDENRMFCKFMKLKPLIFQGIIFEDALEFIIYYQECLHKMGIIKKYCMKFDFFQLLNKSKQQWRSIIECKASLPLLTWAQIQNMFFEMYVPRTYHDQKKDRFLRLEKGYIFVVAYEVNFYALSRYALKLITSEEERIRYFVKGLNLGI